MKSKPLFKLDLQQFAEDPNPADPQNPAEPAPQDPGIKKYLDALEEQKKNSVSKEAYAKLEAENKELFNAVLNGGSLKSGSPKSEEKPDIKQLREELYGGKASLNNLEYAKKTLELRKALMDEGEIDPFVPVGKNISPDENDFAKAQAVADVIQECIDTAEGDSGVFTNLLQLKTVEAMPRVAMPKFLQKK